MFRYLLLLLLLLGFSCNSKVVETQHSFKNGDYSLNGSLTIPFDQGKFPVVILVHGSGPLNRDQEIPLINEDQHCIYPGLKGDTLRIFKDLARQLSQKGLAVFRYDKRNFTYPEVNNDLDFSPYDLIEDVHSAIDFVKTMKQIDTGRIVLLGHSQGANLIPIVAKERNDIIGLIGLSTPSIRIDSIIMEQIDTIMSLCPKLSNLKEFEDVKQEIKRLRSGSLKESEPVLGWYSNYWHDWMQVTAGTIENYQMVSIPLYFIWGTSDFNVSIDNTLKLDESLNEPQSEVNYIIGLNHFLTASSDPKLHSNVVRWIVEWMNEKKILQP